MMYIKGTVQLQHGQYTINGETHFEENYICTAYKAGNPEPFTSIRPTKNEAIENVLKMIST